MDRSEMKLTLRGKVLLAVVACLPAVLAGCASNKSGGAAGSDIIPPDGLGSVWRNAGAREACDLAIEK